MATHQTSSLPSDRRAGRGFLLAGIGLAVVAVGLLALQWSLKILIVPWYVPIGTAFGAMLVLWSLTRRVGVIRIIVLVLLIGVAGFTWFTLAVGGKLPQYTGPLQAGKKLPPFRTTLADGSSFTQSDLEDGQRRVLTFFRGRW
ncbi:MAG TPA: hypothetical protein VFB96_09125 [Pirellulaceae bacterium]|nr:hypothetical protein [Pirellulaceae bacterium]